MIISSSMKKIISRDDCLAVARGVCLCDQGFQFQLCLDEKCRDNAKIVVESDLSDVISVYRVMDVKGTNNNPMTCKTDDYYIHSENEYFPDLLRRVDALTTADGEKCVLLVDVASEPKPCGIHNVKVSVGDESACFELEVKSQRLADTDLILTNWFHIDGICNYYGVKPFSEEFYERFEWFLKAYVEMGNNMILVPAFTAPLDTEVGRERLTTQLVSIVLEDGKYTFDFAEMRRFIRLCRSYGIKYLEHSHLFTQWGGECCPKIMVRDGDEEINAFGWAVRSTDERYLDFLSQYLKQLQEFLKDEGVFEDCYLHLTDEPYRDHIPRYKTLSEFVKSVCDLKTIDALSEKALSEAVNMPAVAIYSEELPLFDDNKMLYYCVGVDTNYITNRYLNMPLQRTEIIGFQLYANRAKGFLHWGYNFYNTQLSKAPTDPYSDTMSGGGFPAGDSFIVYPGECETEKSIRYYSMKRAFEDYRLLKTLEARIGKSAVMQMLSDEGVCGVHDYPRSVEWHEEFRQKIISMLA